MQSQFLETENCFDFARQIIELDEEIGAGIGENRLVVWGAESNGIS